MRRGSTPGSAPTYIPFAINMDRPLARYKAITLCTAARNFSFGVRLCHVTVLTVWGAMDLRRNFEGRRRAETGERASLSGSGVRDRPSESVKLFSRGIVVERWSCLGRRVCTKGGNILWARLQSAWVASSTVHYMEPTTRPLLLY